MKLMNRYIPPLFLSFLLLTGCDPYVPDEGEHTNPVDPGTPGAPAVPSAPSPAHEANGISLNPTLSWTSSDPDDDQLTYDLYLGTVEDAPLVVSDLTESSYRVTGLSNSTTYYWLVFVSDGDHTISSPLWQFRTVAQGNTPPNAPSSPTPAQNALGIAMLPTLSWDASDDDDDELTFDLYFGTSNNPPLIQTDLDAMQYQLQASGFGTRYYWKIVAHDTEDSTESAIWNFTTESNGGLRPFPNVTETGLSYAIVVNSATIDGTELSTGDIVAVYDGDVCVGWKSVESAADVVITAWEADPVNNLNVGFTTGNAMRFIIWDQDTNKVYLPSISMRQGDGTFGYQPYSEVDLTAESGR
jgi:hypothetical protein